MPKGRRYYFMWRKRILRAMIFISVIVAIAASTSVLAFAASSIDTIKLVSEVTDSINNLKEKELDIVFTPSEYTEATFETAAYAVDPASFDVASDEEYGFVNLIVTIPNDSTTPTIEPTFLAETPTMETEPDEDSVVVQTVLNDDPLAINLIETHENGTKVYSFKNGTYTVPYNPVGNEAQVSESGYVEKILEVPQYFQQAYHKTKYGSHGTVSSHGCGITSCAMVYTYLLDRWIMPDELAETYGRYNTPVGSDYALFTKSAEDFGLGVQVTYKWEDVVTALENGSVVIANVQSDTIFTSGGHFIVYYGITDDGKILINDPSIYNYGQWSSKALTEGFANGFDQKYCKYSFPCWIYSPKDIEFVASVSEINNT